MPFYNATKEELALAPDDVWRLFLMTILFGLLFPLSMLQRIKACRRDRYTFAMLMHLFAGLMFAVDIIRKPSHPHSKVFNIPIVVYWVIDRLAGIFVYRTGEAKITSYLELDGGRYLILFLQRAGRKARGQVMYLQFTRHLRSLFDYAHPFTIWTRQGLLTVIEDRARSKLLESGRGAISFTIRRSRCSRNGNGWY